MKCLLRSTSFNNVEKLKEHYVTYHKIDKDNKFFQKLFNPAKKGSTFCKFLKCGDLSATENFKVKNNFLKHDIDG